MADVFISYKRAERQRVERISELLREKGFDVWFDAKLEIGRGEGFDAEIEREVTSAGCVLVCWTPEAIKSVYVKAEAKKGLERQVLVPLFLEPCDLPIPFNGLDTGDLSHWNGESTAIDWQRILTSITEKVERAKANEKQLIARSVATYERISDQIYPGTLALLTRRITAGSGRAAEDFQIDIEAVLSWIESLAEKEVEILDYGYGLAGRQPGGDAWRWWDRGGATARSAQIGRVRNALSKIDALFARSQKIVDRPCP